MAELVAAGNVLGVASSLITFGSVAWDVVERLKEYCDRTKDVPNVIKHIIPQLEVLAQKIEEAESDASLVNSSQSSGFMVHFAEQIHALDKLAAMMLPTKGDSWKVRSKKAILSIYYEKELSNIWEELERCKTTFLVHHTNVLSRPVLSLESNAPKTHYYYPTSVVGHFVTRPLILSQVEFSFSQTHATANPHVLVLLGLGGCGKTQLARQYCQESEEERRFSNIFGLMHLLQQR
jgi:hypothetical protein